MSIGEVLLILWRRGWIIALTFSSALIVVVGVLMFVPGRYDATATAAIDPGSIDPVTEMGMTSPSAIGLVQGNLTELVTSQRVGLDVVKRLNLTENPTTQQQYRNSSSFGRESIEDWLAASLQKNVDPKFELGTNVLTIKYKTGDPNRAALIANAYLSATIDNMIEMKAASGQQTARWFAPQLDDMRKELDNARVRLEAFQAKTNLAAPTATSDPESSTLAAITQELSADRATLTILESRLASGATNLSTDPSDPDLQLLAGLKEKLSNAQASLESVKDMLGARNPKFVALTANIAELRKQTADSAVKMREHLKERIASTKDQIAKLEISKAAAEKDLIAVQAQRNRLGELQRDVAYRIEQLDAREKMADQARLQSKLTFANIAVLDKAAPPIEPAFPKPIIVIPVGVGAALVLGLVLALLAEMTDRRIRSTNDLQFAAKAPVLGVIRAQRRIGSRAARRALRAA